MTAAAKADLRRRMRSLRRRLSHDHHDAADLAANWLPAALTRHGMVVAGYAPIGGELDPRPVMRRFVDAGARLVLPAVRERDRGLEFLAWAEGDPLAPDALGIPSPLATSERLLPEVILAPLLAFDRRGGRLGQGGGYFDRAIVSLRAQGPLKVVGLAFAGQEVAETACEAHDARLDAILTEAGYIEAAIPIRRTP